MPASPEANNASPTPVRSKNAGPPRVAVKGVALPAHPAYLSSGWSKIHLHFFPRRVSLGFLRDLARDPGRTTWCSTLTKEHAR